MVESSCDLRILFENSLRFWRIIFNLYKFFGSCVKEHKIAICLEISVISRIGWVDFSLIWGCSPLVSECHTVFALYYIVRILHLPAFVFGRAEGKTLKNELKTKEGRKANPSHTKRNSSASHRSSCVLEFASLINCPSTSASEHLSCYIYTSKHSHEQQISTIKYKESCRNPYNGTSPWKIIRVRRERRRMEFYKI